MRSYPARASLAMLLTVAAAAAACSGGNGGDTLSTPVPTEEGATPRATIYPESSEGQEQVFFNLACTGDVLTIVTTARTLHAELPCDRVPPQEVIERFQSAPVEIEVIVGAPSKLFLRSEAAGSLEFTVENVRVVDE